MFDPIRYTKKILSDEEFIATAAELDGEFLRIEVWHAVARVAAVEYAGSVVEMGEVPDINAMTDAVLPHLLPHLRRPAQSS